MKTTAKAGKAAGKWAATVKLVKKQKTLHLMALPVVIWLVIFSYIPMLGIQIAFKNYKFNEGIWGSEWVGFEHFEDIFNDPFVYDALYNTIGMSLIKVFLLFPVPILFALLLNEIRNMKFKRVAQTITYFPYFISWPVLAVMLLSWFSPTTGFINEFLVTTSILDEPYLFFGEPEAFWWMSLFVEMWKATGWGSIVYLAAIAGIDQEMFEAATIDGVNRFQKIVYIILPSILGTIMVMFIMNVGNMMVGGLYASNFNFSYLLGNTLNISRSEILETYILKIGVSQGRFSYATAVGLLQSLVSVVLLFTANFTSNKITGQKFL